MNAGVKQLREQRARMALGYLVDAGFDPRQSPEAWRLLAPTELPKNTSKLKYPPLARFELQFLDEKQKETPIGERRGGSTSADQAVK